MGKFVRQAVDKLTTFVGTILGKEVELIKATPNENGGLIAHFKDKNNNQYQWSFYDESAIEFRPNESFDEIYYTEWQCFMKNHVLLESDVADYSECVKSPTSRHMQEKFNFYNAIGKTV